MNLGNEYSERVGSFSSEISPSAPSHAVSAAPLPLPSLAVEAPDLFRGAESGHTIAQVLGEGDHVASAEIIERARSFSENVLEQPIYNIDNNAHQIQEVFHLGNTQVDESIYARTHQRWLATQNRAVESVVNVIRQDIGNSAPSSQNIANSSSSHLVSEAIQASSHEQPSNIASAVPRRRRGALGMMLEGISASRAEEKKEDESLSSTSSASENKVPDQASTLIGTQARRISPLVAATAASVRAERDLSLTQLREAPLIDRTREVNQLVARAHEALTAVSIVDSEARRATLLVANVHYYSSSSAAISLEQDEQEVANFQNQPPRVEAQMHILRRAVINGELRNHLTQSLAAASEIPANTPEAHLAAADVTEASVFFISFVAGAFSNTEETVIELTNAMDAREQALRAARNIREDNTANPNFPTYDTVALAAALNALEAADTLIQANLNDQLDEFNSVTDISSIESHMKK